MYGVVCGSFQQLVGRGVSAGTGNISKLQVKSELQELVSET